MVTTRIVMILPGSHQIAFPSDSCGTDSCCSESGSEVTEEAMEEQNQEDVDDEQQSSPSINAQEEP